VSLIEDLRGTFLTSELTDEQREELIAAGEERHFAPGDDLFHQGLPADRLWVLVEGEIELTRRLGDETMVIPMAIPGQWAGGTMAWSAEGDSVFRASGRARTAVRCLIVPAEALAELVERWSPFAKHMLTGVYQTLRGLDAAARERESLLALGTLAAGLAHEINNPASAAMRDVESLGDTAGYMLSALVDLAELGVLAEQFLALDRRRTELQARPPEVGGAIATADREEAIGTWMEDRGMDLAWRMAPVLASAGVDRAWLDELEAEVGRVAAEPSLRWISSTLGMAGLLDELGEATSRITHLVQDVKTYSNLDRASLQWTDVRAGLESTLAMLRSKLDGIEVVTDFDGDVTEIEGYTAELNQVWTNLIDNAIDAMGGSGTLRVRTSVDVDRLVVEITDSGPGMDRSVQARAFEPFFTTKDVGKGTGLGLDISRRIVVDRHGGEIGFDSTPGSTTARVRLPIGR
jgi:signal transduction histidine kinase